MFWVVSERLELFMPRVVKYTRIGVEVYDCAENFYK
ncbi:hypothetical protein BN8_04961 [Fibrisoma limi BUZ 3]|uniref:Uncharacterized protein n=1 Tax=Fibrisoma limi BUZ 3 TaxID=1185876 RepID=I2GP55_9BACT|nr:hypothetical protein BN8_04961 [Fibrisoma limi BUZ 3]